MERRLAAILVADVVGYSRLIRSDEEGTLAPLKALRADLVDPKFGEDHAAVFGLEKPIGFAGGTRLAIQLEFNVNNKHNIGRLRLAIRLGWQAEPV